jgi:hypothetical protein
MVVAHCSPKHSLELANLCALSGSAFVLPRRHPKTREWIYCSGGCVSRSDRRLRSYHRRLGQGIRR